MRHFQGIAIVLLGLGLGACGTAPEQPGPLTPILNTQSDLRFGERLTAELGASGTAGEWSVALLIEGPDGEINQLLPNKLAPDFKVTTGKMVTFPDSGATFGLIVGSPAGKNTLLLVLSPRPVNLEGISRYAGEQDAFAVVQRQGIGVLLGEVKQERLRLNPGSAATDRILTVRP